jgi:hypothetical protein
MYGEAVLRASFHAGWPTLGGVPGRLTPDFSNALDLASHESSAGGSSRCTIPNTYPIVVSIRLFGVQGFPHESPKGGAYRPTRYRRATVQQPDGRLQIK